MSLRIIIYCLDNILHMKGFIISKTIIILMLTLIMLGAFAPAIAGSLDEYIKRTLFVQTEQMAGLINVMQASPSGTSHKFFLPKGECELTVTNGVINLTQNKNSIVREIISHMVVEDKKILCIKGEDKVFYIKRCGDRIFIDERERRCN